MVKLMLEMLSCEVYKLGDKFYYRSVYEFDNTNVWYII